MDLCFSFFCSLYTVTYIDYSDYRTNRTKVISSTEENIAFAKLASIKPLVAILKCGVIEFYLYLNLYTIYMCMPVRK